MKYRSVGKSGLKISEVALGSWVTDLKGTAIIWTCTSATVLTRPPTLPRPCAR